MLWVLLQQKHDSDLHFGRDLIIKSLDIVEIFLQHTVLNLKYYRRVALGGKLFWESEWCEIATQCQNPLFKIWTCKCSWERLLYSISLLIRHLPPFVFQNEGQAYLKKCHFTLAHIQYDHTFVCALYKSWNFTLHNILYVDEGIHECGTEAKKCTIQLTELTVQ